MIDYKFYDTSSLLIAQGQSDFVDSIKDSNKYSINVQIYNMFLHYFSNHKFFKDFLTNFLR